MYPYWNEMNRNEPNRFRDYEVLTKRIKTIESQLNRLGQIFLQQQQLFTQLQQPYFNTPYFLHQEQQSFHKSVQYQQERAQEMTTDQPEPGVPPEISKQPEKPRKVFIPPGVSGVIRM